MTAHKSPFRGDLLQGKVALVTGGSTTEVAEAVLFLASDAASYVTGATLVVDGGGWLTASGIPDLPGSH